MINEKSEEFKGSLERFLQKHNENITYIKNIELNVVSILTTVSNIDENLKDIKQKVIRYRK